MVQNNQPHIVIGVGTLDRPNWVYKTIKSLANQVLPNNTQITILVIDNSPNGSAEHVVKNFESESKFPIHYHKEKSLGIVNVRNRVLNESSKLGASHIAFIDDDEIAASDWIAQLFQNMHIFKAQAAQGTTIRCIPPNSPNWLKKYGLLDLKKHKTGSIRKSAGTRNVLFDFDFVNKHSLRFNHDLNLMGSSDTLFFKQLFLKGAKIIWVDEARVIEYLPENRVNASWLVQRSFREGVTEFEINRILANWANLYTNGFVSTMKAILFSFLALGLLPVDRSLSLKLFLNVAKAMGFFYRLMGFNYYEYGKTYRS
jgi:succinoglycan biosynthesis protein ExoM